MDAGAGSSDVALSGIGVFVTVSLPDSSVGVVVSEDFVVVDDESLVVVDSSGFFELVPEAEPDESSVSDGSAALPLAQPPTFRNWSCSGKPRCQIAALITAMLTRTASKAMPRRRPELRTHVINPVQMPRTPQPRTAIVIPL